MLVDEFDCKYKHLPGLVLISICLDTNDEMQACCEVVESLFRAY